MNRFRKTGSYFKISGDGLEAFASIINAAGLQEEAAALNDYGNDYGNDNYGNEYEGGEKEFVDLDFE